MPSASTRRKAAVAAAALDAGAQSSTTSRPVAPTPTSSTWSPSAAPGSSRCTCRASRGPCRPTPATPTWSPRWATSSSTAPGRARGRHRGGVDRADPGHRVRQDRSPTTSSSLAHLDDLVARVDVPVLVGPSRKRSSAGSSPTRSARIRLPDGATTARSATAVWAVDRGAAIVRVHDVRPRAVPSACCVMEHGRRERRVAVKGDAGPRASSPAASAGSSRTASRRRSAPAASPATTARCGARRS